MRVITGTARGKKLASPEGEHTRPTLERIKEAIFSIIQFDIANKDVLDLFAGSGQLGIEALSRGAKYAEFVDNDKNACDVITSNLKSTDLSNKAKVICGECFSHVRHKRDCEKYGLIFIDAPYGKDLADDMLKNIAANDICGEDAIIVCECARADKYKDSYGEFVLYRNKEYASTRILVYKKGG